MNNGMIGAICGPGNGKVELAYGKAVRALIQRQHVIFIQFLKGRRSEGADVLLARLEPELKLFRFEKTDKCCSELTDKEKEEVRMTVINGLNFAKKVTVTGECELLILEGILDLLNHQVVTAEEFKQIFSSPGEVELYLTGEELPGNLKDFVQSVEWVDRSEGKG